MLTSHPLFAASFFILLSTATFAADSESSSSTYGCIAQRVVGIQGEGDKRHHGKIRLSDEESKFLVTISKIAPSSRPWCTNEKSRAVDKPYQYWWECLSENEMSFSKKKSPLALRGDGVHVFRGIAADRFHIGVSGHYTYSYTNYGGDHYLEEGECTLIQQ
jgi:hypothetical protein